MALIPLKQSFFMLIDLDEIFKQKLKDNITADTNDTNTTNTTSSDSKIFRCHLSINFAIFQMSDQQTN